MRTQKVANGVRLGGGRMFRTGGPGRVGRAGPGGRAGGKLPEILFRQIYKINPTKGAKRR